MKNTIPLIMAVILGLAAVFAVSRTVARSSASAESRIAVVVAAGNLRSGGALARSDLARKQIPQSAYISHQHIRWDNLAMIEGQRIQRDIAKGGFILLNDVEGTDGGFSSEVGNSQWVVPVHFSDSTLVKLLQPNDEIAIVTIRDAVKRHEVTGGAARTELTSEQVASVVFPCIRIMRKDNDNVLVALPPPEAMKLLMANRNMPLYPMLRRKGDVSNAKVSDVGVTTLGDLDYESLVGAERKE